jgi:hypothetical protein
MFTRAAVPALALVLISAIPTLIILSRNETLYE